MVGAGADDAFGTPGDLQVGLTLADFTDDRRAIFNLTNTVLTPGRYRLTVGTAVTDRAGNALAAPFVGEFIVVGVSSFTNEDGDNNTLATADPLGSGLGVPNGSFLDRGRTTATAGWPFDVELADFNRDGKLDAAVSHLGSVDGLRFYPGLGTRAFGPPVIFDGIGDEPHDLELLDWDKDGDLDVAVTVAGTDAVALFRNDSVVAGAIAFTRLTDIPVGDEPLRLVGGDFNGDTFPDLACANRGTDATTGRCVSILTNTQSGSFTETKTGRALAPRIRA